MRQFIYLMMIVAAVTAGCTKTDKSQQTTAHDRQPKDTVHTIKAAMGIYGYQPERALQIVDSALIVGNMTGLQAEQCRARIYCMSLMKERVDSLLGGPKDVCLDSARAIGERILHNDTIKNDLRRRQDVLEILAHTARMKKDTTGWMRWSYELIDVCRQLGGPAETDALRTEAEVGAALYALGQHEEGMAKLDHVIEALSEKPDFKFNELDALIINIMYRPAAVRNRITNKKNNTMKKKIFSMLVLIMTAVTGAWADNYYLVGTMNDWGASKQFLLTQNPYNDAEYMITLTLKAGAALKVIGVGENTTTWFPDGFDNNYVVNTAGKYTVYFSPDYQGGGDWHYGCIHLEAAPAPAIPVNEAGSNEWKFTMPDYAVVANVEYETELELQEENVNTTVLADWDGYEADITLKRTLTAGMWNTLAVPFNVSSQMLGHLTSTYGMSVKQLASTSLENDGKTLMLNFTDATEMVAGTPYLVKVSTDYDFSARALPNVEVSQELNPVQTDYADFIPTLGKTLVTGPEGDKSNTDAVLFLAAGNTLKNPAVVNDPEQQSSYMKGFRAYFQLKNASAARSFSLNLGDEATGIQFVATESQPTGQEAQAYDLQGRRVNGAAQKGVYIVNGKKTIK